MKFRSRLENGFRSTCFRSIIVRMYDLPSDIEKGPKMSRLTTLKRLSVGKRISGGFVCPGDFLNLALNSSHSSLYSVHAYI